MGDKKAFALTAAVFVLCVLAAGSVVFWAEHKLSKLVLNGLGESFSTKVYSAPLVLFPEAKKAPSSVLRRLLRLKYVPVQDKPSVPGQFRGLAPDIEIFLRGFQSPSFVQEPKLVKIIFSSKGVEKIEGEDGSLLDSAAAEPELIAELSGTNRVRREPTRWEEIPPLLSAAVVAAEDKRFYTHHGIDVRSIGRAVLHNLKRGGKLEGGSTLSQQLAKNLLLTPRRNLTRKLLDACFGIYLDFRLGKEKLLTIYLNQVYMGQDGYVSVAGVEAGAEFYFGKKLGDLTLSECATLAALIKSPLFYNPATKSARAIARRDYVLKRMLDDRQISPADYEKALKEPLSIRAGMSAAPQSDSDYFISEVIRQISPRYDETVLFRSGLTIHTTMDPLMQKAAQDEISAQKHEGALIAVNPQSGQVLALSGGRNFKESQFNRATQALRQPGSAFKPFVTGAALENGYTLATLLSDKKRNIKNGGNSFWAPRNFDGIYHGTVTVRDALAHSYNLATLDLAEKIGIEKITAFAEKLGISGVEPNFSSALGSSETTLWNLAAAYAPFANGGFKVKPFLVTAVQDADGRVLEISGAERAPVLAPSVAYLVTSALETAVREGTANNLKSLGWAGPAAGKTGTTSDGKDAWFIGYTPEILTGVWIGDDIPKASGLSGTRNAVPVWEKFMTTVSGGLNPSEFKKPETIITKKIDPANGLLARWTCPEKREENFLEGTEPKEYCPLHANPVKSWISRLFGKKPLSR